MANIEQPPCATTSCRKMKVKDGDMNMTIQPTFQSKVVDASTPLYHYDKLDDRGGWIRVLHLRPSTRRIECFMRHIKHTDGGYQALSYVWGSEDAIFKAYVLDSSTEATIGYIPLTKNLYHALCDLRDSQDVADMVFWIDQICIDQVAMEEKNHQVAMMGKIYSNASRVITYIGPSDPDDQWEEEGIKLLQRLNEHFSPNYKIFEEMHPWDITTNVSLLPVTQLPVDLADEDPEKFSGWRWLVEVIVLGDWTTRLWMVQEQLLNRNAVMLRGQRLLSWDSVAIIACLYIHDLLPDKSVYHIWNKKVSHTMESDASYDWSSTLALAEIWRTRQELRKDEALSLSTSRYGRSLLDNIYTFNALSCRDPRDRIYALLAISYDSPEFGIDLDYTMEEKSVFRDVSARMYLTDQHLWPFQYICYWDNRSDPTHPSWALGTARRSWSEKALWTAHTHTKRTHPNETTNIKFSPDKQTMYVRGRKVDSIRFGSFPIRRNASITRAVFDAEYAYFYLKLLNAWSKILLDVPRISLDSVSALCRSLLADPTWSPTPRHGNSQDQERCYLLLCIYCSLFESDVVPHLEIVPNTWESQAIKEAKEVIEQLGNLCMQQGKDEGKDEDEDEEEEQLFQFSDSISYQWGDEERNFFDSILKPNRSFGKTSRGHVFNSMHETEAADVIVVLEGSVYRLWNLRPAGNDKYRLVGEIYVDGYMKGELYDGVNPEDVDYEICLV